MELTRLTGVRRSTTRILVVDDEESVCKVIGRALSPLGYTVDTALYAEAALDVMKRVPADVALVDIRMPGRDGVWLIDRLQEAYPSTAIVIVTGMRDLDARLTLRPGVIGYVTKPFDGKKMREMVMKAVAAVESLPHGNAIRGLSQPVSDREIAELPDVGDD